MNKLIEDHPAWKQLQADRAEAARKLDRLNSRIAKATEAWRERTRLGRERWLADDATEDEIAAVVEPMPDLTEVLQQKQRLVHELGELSQPNGPVERAVLAKVARDALPELEASERALVKSAAEAARVLESLASDWQRLVTDVERLRVATDQQHQRPVYGGRVDIHAVLDTGLRGRSLLNRPPEAPAGTRASFNTDQQDGGVAAFTSDDDPVPTLPTTSRATSLGTFLR